MEASYFFVRDPNFVVNIAYRVTFEVAIKARAVVAGWHSNDKVVISTMSEEVANDRFRGLEAQFTDLVSWNHS